jgi:pimeloyl-ACP methyl ester carboxylesterase
MLVTAFSPLPVAARQESQLGTIVLRPCPDGLGQCGSIRRALDPTDVVPGMVTIGFRLIGQRDPNLPPKRTVVIVDGGPGFGATRYASDYIEMFGDAGRDRALLFVDNRGTGSSGALSCAALDRRPDLPLAAVRRCGEQLGTKAHLYGSQLAADDLAALLDAAALPRIDLYTLSYGTYFAQVFTARHPDRLGKLILDSAYPVRGGTSFYEEQAPAMRASFAAACARSPQCEGGADGWNRRFGALLVALRTKPISGFAANQLGQLVSVRADAQNLFAVMTSGGMGRVAYRELDAAARAFLNDHDHKPLLRLMAETRSLLGGGGDRLAPIEFSPATFVAVSCSDYPKLFDMHAAPATRRGQLETNLSTYLAQNPGVYAPFTFNEFRTSPVQENLVDLCLDWPWPATKWLNAAPIEAGVRFPDIPTLILNGEFDTITTVAEGKAVARQFPAARFVELPNSVHTSPVGDLYECGSVIVRRFLDDGAAVDTRCAATVPPVRTIGRFVRRMSDVRRLYPALPNPRRLAVVAAAAGDDAIARARNATGRRARGLRDGSIDIRERDDRTILRLNGVRWVEDARVDGMIVWEPTMHRARASLTVRADSGAPIRARYAWNPEALEGLVSVTGMQAARPFAVRLP